MNHLTKWKRVLIIKRYLPIYRFYIDKIINYF